MSSFGNADKPFNSSINFLERIEETWKLVTQAKLEGNIVAYFRLLEDIFRSTHPIFTDDETDSCEEQISICEGHLKSAVNNRDVSNWAAENECDTLKMMLVKLLFDYNITYFKNKEKDWKEKTEEDFS